MCKWQIWSNGSRFFESVGKIFEIFHNLVQSTSRLHERSRKKFLTKFPLNQGVKHHNLLIKEPVQKVLN